MSPFPDALPGILQLAATAPGNWTRFQAAGLLSPHPQDGAMPLAADWQERFLQVQPIDKGSIRHQPGQFLAHVDDIVYRGTTSGTGGRHFVYFADSRWNQMRLQARQRSLGWWGIDETIPIINLSSRLFPVRLCDLAIAGPPTPERIDRLLTHLAISPAAIRGYPSRLCDIAAALAGQTLPFVVAVIATGECLFDFQKSLLERVFAAPVINEYGCQESGISGLSCPEVGRLHLDSDRCLYETIDGRLVTTDLFNRVMPMVRYQCGDALRLQADPCPCGRPGPTATVLGRVDERIQVAGGMCPIGEVHMPALPGILRYRAICGKTQVALQVVPASMDQPINLQPVMDWARASFGHGTAQVSLQDANLAPAPVFPPREASVWIDTLTHGSWETWLKQGWMPQGEAQAVAQLLHQLSHPDIISYHRLPLSTWTQLQTVLQQAPSRDGAIAHITARILLFACSFMAEDPSVDQIYRHGVQRLEHPATCLGGRDAIAQGTLDRLIPTLFLPTHQGFDIWQNWLHQMDQQHTDPVLDWPLDTLTIHHLLHAFEPAVQRAYQSPHPMLQALRPLVSLLLGDLSYFAAQLGPWLLAYWFQLLHQQPLPQSRWLQPPDDFTRAWVDWRQQLQTHPQQASISVLERGRCSPQGAASTPDPTERIQLERGYGLLIQQQALNPDEWMPVLQAIHTHAGGLSDHEIDPTPWHPILKALVKPLFARGDADRAYDCLVAVNPQNSRFSAFERLASQHNYKQPVLLQGSLAG